MDGKRHNDRSFDAPEAELRRQREMLRAANPAGSNSLDLYEQSRQRLERQEQLRNRLDLADQVRESLAAREQFASSVKGSTADDAIASSSFYDAQRILGDFGRSAAALADFVQVPDWTIKSLDNAHRSICKELSPSLADSLAAMKESLSSILGSAEQARGAVSRLGADWSGLAARIPDTSLLLGDTKAISRVADSALGINSMLIGAGTQADRLVAPLRDFAAATASYSALHTEQVARLVGGFDLAELEAFRFALPTASVRDYGFSVHHYAAISVATEETAIADSATNEVGDLLDERLTKLDLSLVDLRRGARDALSSHSRDKVRQATHSSRELLRAVLDMLAPEDVVPAKEGRPTRKERVRYLFRGRSNSLSQYIDAQAYAINEMYSRLSNLAHTGNSIELSALCAINACETLLLNILVELEASEEQ